MTYTVSIAGVAPDPEVYVGLANATNYIAAQRIRPEAKKWLALAEDDKESTLVAATQYIEVRSWAGAATGADGTTLSFPREGGGITDTAAEQLARVEKAVCELAMAIAVNPALITAIDQGSNIKKLDGDGPSIEYFKGTSVADGSTTWMPVIVQRLLSRYVAAASSSVSAPAGGISHGSCGESVFDANDSTDRDEAF